MSVKISLRHPEWQQHTPGMFNSPSLFRTILPGFPEERKYQSAPIDNVMKMQMPNQNVLFWDRSKAGPRRASGTTFTPAKIAARMGLD